MKTMTLEDLRAELVHDSRGRLDRAFDAAIHERDELRHDLSEVEEHAKIYCRERDAAMALNLENAKGAEKAEVELAKLRERITGAPLVTASPLTEAGRTWVSIDAVKNPGLAGHRVRLLVDDDDA